MQSAAGDSAVILMGDHASSTLRGSSKASSVSTSGNEAAGVTPPPLASPGLAGLPPGGRKRDQDGIFQGDEDDSRFEPSVTQSQLTDVQITMETLSLCQDRMEGHLISPSCQSTHANR